MKKKILIIIGAIVLLVAIVLFFIFHDTAKYTIKVSLIDDYSPDRILTVYNEKKEKIEVNRIEYLDGTLLCQGYNTTVHFGDIESEKELKVILKDKTAVKAKIIKDEVK